MEIWVHIRVQLTNSIMQSHTLETDSRSPSQEISLSLKGPEGSVVSQETTTGPYHEPHGFNQFANLFL